MQLMNFLSANTALVICYILDVILVFIILATLCFVYLKSNKSNSETPTKSNKLDSNENNNQLEPAIPADYFNSEESNEIAYILLEDGYKPIEISKIKQATKFNKNHDSTIKKSENLKKSETLQKKPKKQP